MNTRACLQSRSALYLAERRRLGFSCRNEVGVLRSFVNHVRSVGHRGPLTVEVMADWARHDSHGSTDPHTWARRLKRLRNFTRWLRQFEPRTEVPDDTIFGPLPERQAHTSTASRRWSICWRQPDGSGLHPDFAARSSRRCSA